MLSTLRLFDDFFFSWPDSTKPPIDQFPVKDKDGMLQSWMIQVAVSGFKEEDIKVWHENQTLYISGDNSNSENLAPKFRSNFKYKIGVYRDLDKAEVTLDKGILSIEIPVNEVPKVHNILFGKPPNKQLSD